MTHDDVGGDAAIGSLIQGMSIVGALESLPIREPRVEAYVVPLAVG